jgi:hypothetical protein
VIEEYHKKVHDTMGIEYNKIIDEQDQKLVSKYAPRLWKKIMQEISTEVPKDEYTEINKAYKDASHDILFLAYLM